MKINKCIKNLLTFINVLQKNSVNQLCLDDCCCKPFLGPTNNPSCYNTRVITLYNCQGTLVSTSFLLDNESLTSSTFRIQDIHDDCCTLLILNNNNGTYTSTGQYITFDLSCIAAVKCLGDVYVSIL